MKLFDEFRDRASTLQDDLRLHGTTIAGAVRTNSYAVGLVALVSVLALIVGVTALAKAKR